MSARRGPRTIDPFEPQQIRRLVAEFGSPLLIVDCARIRTQYRRLQRALPGVHLHYALKPLPHQAVVRTIVEEGGSLDLATTGEVQVAAALGVDPAVAVASKAPSPGEARKLEIALGLARRVWLCVLDEPTNHLDLPSIERLEAALAAYPGALVLATHDGPLAERCTERCWRFAGGRILVEDTGGD